jgi:peptidoglycan glycosyltransferase
VNRALKRLSVAVLVMFLLLLINVNYLQGVEPASLATEPGNTRAFNAQFQYQRGSIITSDGVTIAASKLSPAGDSIKYQRYYTAGPVYAPVTGYDSIYATNTTGASGIELQENSVLNGNDSSQTIRNFIDLITGKPRKGANVEVTINSAAQQAAYAGLVKVLGDTGRVGAAVAIDPATGAILAMASYPSYNPDLLAVHDGPTLNSNDKTLLNAEGNPLLNHAISYTNAPGSTFKIVTSSAFFNSSSANTPSTSVSSPTTLALPQTTNVLTNNDGEACGTGGGQATILYAFAQSCDTTFGKLGITLGSNTLNSVAEAFGMNSSTLAIPMPVTSSNYTLPASEALTAYSAIGQYSDTVTALQEAMFSAAIANHGELMKPYLVQQVIASDLNTLSSASPSVLSQAVSPTVAGYVSQMMQAVVQQPEGTAYAFNQAALGGTCIAGKTGTAQTGASNSGPDDAVFTSFAPCDNPTIAVGVIIQGGGYGATAAAPVAVDVIQAYLKALGTK